MDAHATAMENMEHDHRKLGIWVFLASEVIFFAAIITTFIIYRERSVGGPDPKHILTLLIPTINTMVLLVSSVTMVAALQSIKEGNRTTMWRWLVITAVLGSTFLFLKGTEYSHLFSEGLTPNANIFGSVYFTLTGFHAAHVLIGVIWLLAVAAKAIRGGFSAENFLPVEIVGLYWHFVD
ncbi:MAG: heme-copper oxidase subunit III, partial [Chloroflexi bacterium]|nr:heme-copper oxidase subunit III [Chloroflexota bacterium]